MKIEDYALLSNCRSAALVGRDGSIDWLCLPRFDSGACFAALLGTKEHGRWLLHAPDAVEVRRRYLDNTLVLETEFVTATGRCRMLDCLLMDDAAPRLVRFVEGLAGRVEMELELIIRFDYGSIVPWVRKHDGEIAAVGGPDTLRLRTPVPLSGQGFSTVSRFTVEAGQKLPLVLTWHPSHHPAPPNIDDPQAAIAATAKFWRDWAARCQAPDGSTIRDAVVRSLLTLKALTYQPTGGIVAAPTSSLPEWLGGVRNWDYRYCWVRDSTFTLYALLSAGYIEEADRWRCWLLRALAGTPEQVSIMYGLAGERRLTEQELPWLPGYEDSRPVRIGNAAHTQVQLDIFGEVMDTLHLARRRGLPLGDNSWAVQKALLRHLGNVWDQPDEGIWEVRGPRQNFTHSKVMAWLAFERSIADLDQGKFDGPRAEWETLRDRIRDQIFSSGYSAQRGCFVQSYETPELDAALLRLPLVGFIPPDDPRMVRTVAAIERELLQDGLVLRYRSERTEDGLPPNEGTFLPCSFWLVDNYALQGRFDEAQQMFERLLGLRNDLGLLAEEYDPRAKRQLGNFPQAFSHIALVNSAYNLCHRIGPAQDRRSKGMAT